MPGDSSRVWLTTLGCSKNQLDSDKLSVLLGEAGYRAALSPEEADVVMVNTCAFIEEARHESVNTILELAVDRGAPGRWVQVRITGAYGSDLAAEVLSPAR